MDVSLRAIRQTLTGNLCENHHAALACLVDETGRILKKFPADEDTPVFLRSAAKPFQAIALLEHPQALSLSPETWAIISASHAASARQLALVTDLLALAGAHVSDLGCGPHEPADPEKPTALHNNCSGKHAGMLLACRWYDWSRATYLAPDHPLQQRILREIRDLAGTQAVSVGIDGCGAPVFALSLPHAARLFSRWLQRPEYVVMMDAMTRHPEIVGDPDRIDTSLMRISAGTIVAKVGAEGFLGLSNRTLGQGLVLKIRDGSNAARDRLVIGLLREIGWIGSDQAEALWQRPAFAMNRHNTQNRCIGHYEAICRF